MKIRTKYNNNDLSLNLDGINIFYGYSNSGKSTFLTFLADCFSQKRKDYFEIDGSQMQKKEYELIYVESGSTFAEQIKLSTKSFLRKMIYDYVEKVIEEKVDENTKIGIEDFVTTINYNLKEFENLINSDCINDKVEIKFGDISLDSILPDLLTFSFNNDADNCSLSASKEQLYSLLFKYIEKNKHKTILIIDDFDIHFDINTTMNFLKSLRHIVNNNDCFALLSTNKASSMEYLQNEDNIYQIANGRVKNVNNIEKAIYEFLLNKYESNSFEEYAEMGGLTIEEHVQQLYKSILPNIEATIGRLLTNSMCSIIYNISSIANEKVSVYAKNEEEYDFLCFFQKLLNDY